MAGNPAVDSVLASQEFYRLKQVVQSPGDIYEIDESAKAIYIGPDSDISEVQITYYDPLVVGTNLQQANVAVNGPLVGRVDASMVRQVPTTMQPARILAAPNDLVDNAYARPVVGIFGPPLRSFNVPAVIDLIVALKQLPDIPSVRADRTFRFPQVPFEPPTAGPTTGGTDIVLPVYGRRMTSIQVLAPAGVGYVLSIYGVALQPGINPDPENLGFITQGAAVIASTRNIVVRAARDTSVAPPGAPIVNPIGQCDLLVLALEQNPAAPLAGLSFVDIFARVSDREA